MMLRVIRPRSSLAACAAVLIAVLYVAPSRSVRAANAQGGTDAQRETARTLYLRYCSQCHGEKGDGEGYAADIFARVVAEVQKRTELLR